MKEKIFIPSFKTKQVNSPEKVSPFRAMVTLKGRALASHRKTAADPAQAPDKEDDASPLRLQHRSPHLLLFPAGRLHGK